MKLIRPDIIFENQFIDIVMDFKNNYEEPKPFGLTFNGYFDFREVIELTRMFEIGKKLPAGFVKTSVYWLVDDENDNRIVAAVNIRHVLTEALLLSGGNIGYAVRPSERGKGYGKLILKMALEICKSIGIVRALITCDVDNKASAAIILANGGILENVKKNASGDSMARYWIETRRQMRVE